MTRATDGTVVERGDRVTSHRGDVYWFLGVSRGPEHNGTAKVSVSTEPPGTAVNLSGSTRGFYAQVFDLYVTPVDTD